MKSPFHAGEQALQERLGVREHIESLGRRIIRDSMPEQHRQFFAAQPLVFVGSLDAEGRPWASALTGNPGFLRSPDPRTLVVDATPASGDPLASNLAPGAPLGLLGIEFATRRRNRMNGTISRMTPIGFEVQVDQSFGNCPQYIQARAPASALERAPGIVRAESALLSAPAAALVERADTFFIATASEGVDVSHRGGKPGFVRAASESGRTVLTAPDFTGNFLFNTLGNVALNPRAGLLFIDFSTGDVLSLTGEAEIVWDGPELDAFLGAERLLRLRLERGLWLERAFPLRWTAPRQAPQLAATGSWEEVQSLLEDAS